MESLKIKNFNFQNFDFYQNKTVGPFLPYRTQGAPIGGGVHGAFPIGVTVPPGASVPSTDAVAASWGEPIGGGSRGSKQEGLTQKSFNIQSFKVQSFKIPSFKIPIFKIWIFNKNSIDSLPALPNPGRPYCGHTAHSPKMALFPRLPPVKMAASPTTHPLVARLLALAVVVRFLCTWRAIRPRAATPWLPQPLPPPVKMPSPPLLMLVMQWLPGQAR